MSGYCSEKGRGCEFASQLGFCQLSACTKGSLKSPEPDGNKDIFFIYCKNGHLIGDYDEDGCMHIGPVRITTFRADIKITCERCGENVYAQLRYPDIYLEGIYGTVHNTKW